MRPTFLDSSDLWASVCVLLSEAVLEFLLENSKEGCEWYDDSCTSCMMSCMKQWSKSSVNARGGLQSG